MSHTRNKPSAAAIVGLVVTHLARVRINMFGNGARRGEVCSDAVQRLAV